MKICIDDGSTNIKLAWTENGERRNAISPNSFKSEWSAPFGGTQPANYMLDGVRYGFDPVSDRFVQTTDTQYQYSDVNVIAIHHALVKSGITPQEVDVVVTLPLSEYFDTNAQPDMANINRKKANVMRPVEYQNGKAFTIRNVRVMPESIPAGFKALADMSPFESLLIVDLGGTTLDVAKVQGQLAGISQVFCDPHVGVSLMADAVLSVMATNGMRTSHHIANTITAFFGTQLQSRVQNHILREYLGEQPVGSAFVIETGHNHHPWLVHAPTMRVPLTIDGTDAVYNATWAALLAIFQHNKNATTDMKIKTVVFPAMGAGCGQVPFESVARQMKQAWDNFNKKTESINWEYAQSRQSAVFGTYAYCPGNSVCRYADTKYIGCGDYRTCCSRSGQLCINPEHQADDVLIQHQANNRFRPGSHIHRINPENPVGNVTSGAHSHGSSIVIGTPTHTLNKQYSVSDIK